MPLRTKPQSSPEHWSKDFVEHLRTVHFALVTISVGLIVVLSSTKYDPKVAYVQLEDIISLRNQWRTDPSFLSSGQVDLTDLDTKERISGHNFAYQPFVQVELDGDLYVFHLPEHIRFSCVVTPDNDSDGPVSNAWSQSKDPGFDSIRQFSRWFAYDQKRDEYAIAMVSR